MRRTKRKGGFFLCLIFNMLLNLDGLIPAAVLLVLHFVIDLSVWWAVAAAAIWIAWQVVWMLFIGFAGRCSVPDPPKENKNPYSVKSNKL